MLFSKVFAAAAFAASALAQGRIGFTSTPSAVTAGKPVVLSWSGGTGSPVTITLKKGDPNDLKTIAILTGGSTGNSYTWTPSMSLANGDDYALSISQGTGIESINYSGLFSLMGGSGRGATVSSSMSTVSTGTASKTATLLSVGSSTTTPLTTITGATTSGLVLTTAATGTGSMAPRNTTFSSPTLGGSMTTSSSGSRSTSTSGTDSSTGAAVALQVQGVVGLGALAAALFFL